MKIQTIPQQNFKGYDARPLKGFLMSSNASGIAEQMTRIGKQEGFKVYKANSSICNTKTLLRNDDEDLWAQDFWTIVKDKLFCRYVDKLSKNICETFNLKTANEYASKHIKGGNFFIVKGDNGDQLILGQDILNDVPSRNISRIYNAKKMTFLPQMDYHIDLFIRPLEDKKVLLADDNLTVEILDKKYGQKSDSFRKAISANLRPRSDEIKAILDRAGYEVISVPGRIYDVCSWDETSYLEHSCNYMNANVIKNKDGDLVYITNKSTGELSIEDEFIESISPYVKKKHIHFVDVGDMLQILAGGIHCACTEVPFEFF